MCWRECGTSFGLPPEGTWGSLQIDLERGDVEGGVLVNVIMFDGPGQTDDDHFVFSQLLTGVTGMDKFRMQVAGRTGGATMNLDIDNLKLQIN